MSDTTVSTADTQDKWPSKDQWLQMLWTAFKTFVTAFLGMLIAFGKGIFDINGLEFKGAAASGIAAVIMVLINFFNPRDPRYGLGSSKSSTSVANGSNNDAAGS